MTTLREELNKAIQNRPSYDVHSQIFYQETRADQFEINYARFDTRFQQHPVLTWLCTDTTVGIFAITLDGALVAYTTQSDRKSDTNIHYMSRDSQDDVVKAVRDCISESEPKYNLAEIDILDTDIEAVNVFENRLLVTEFPALNAMGITVEVTDVYTVYHNSVKIDTMTHRQIDVAEKCAKRFEGKVEFFIDIFFKDED